MLSITPPRTTATKKRGEARSVVNDKETNCDQQLDNKYVAPSGYDSRWGSRDPGGWSYYLNPSFAINGIIRCRKDRLKLLVVWKGPTAKSW